MCTTMKRSSVRISPECQFALCVILGSGGNEDGEKCAPDLYSELKAIVDIGAVASCG